MDSNINHQLIKSYSKSFAEQLINDSFRKESNISGEEILNFCEIKQINYFILKILFDNWQSEIKNLKSPYFDYECEEVKAAVTSLMNALSKNILIGKEDFKELLEEATYKTILLIFSPYEFYLQEINKPSFQKITIQDLYTIQKYIKINAHLLKAYIDRFNTDEIQAVFNEDAVRIFDEVCETIKDTPEDFDNYILDFSKVLPLDLKDIYSQSTNGVNETIEDPPGDLNAENNSALKNKTLLDTLDIEKKDAIIDIHVKKPLDDLKKSITINQRFMFENDLFNGDKAEFEMVINYLENCKNHQEAMGFINENYVEKKNWDMDKIEVKELIELIGKRFPQ